MAPIQHKAPLIGRFLDGIKGLGEDIAAVGQDIGSKGQDLVDTGSSVVDAAGKVQDAVKLYEQWKERVLYYYQLYLDYKWLVWVIIGFILITILLCWLECVWNYYKRFAKICCCTVRLGWWCSQFSWTGFKWCGRHLRNTEKYIPDIEEAHEAARRRGEIAYSGCNSTWITRCGRPIGDDETPAELNEQRLTKKIANFLPGCVPESWTDPEKSKFNIQNATRSDGIKHLLTDEEKQKMIRGIAKSGAKFIKRAKKTQGRAVGEFNRWAKQFETAEKKLNKRRGSEQSDSVEK